MYNGLKLDPSGKFVDYNCVPDIFANLPPASMVSAGTRGWTTDAGLVISNGINWTTPNNVVAANVSPSLGAAANTAALQGAINTANAAGGGIVTIPAFTVPIVMGSTVTLKGGVQIKGSGWQLVQASQRALVGSVLQGDGTFPILAYNNVDSGTPYANIQAILADLLTGVAVEDLAFDTCSYGIQIGAVNKSGIQSSKFKNLICTNHANGWGFWFDNFQYCDFSNLEVHTAQASATGMIHFGGSVGNQYNFGNSFIRRLFIETGAVNKHNIRFLARNVSAINDINVYDMQSNFTGTKITQAATMTNGSANVTVTDGTKFPVDIPVTVDVTNNGFSSYQTYFVVTQVANVLTLSSRMGGAVINATNNAAINLVTYGYPGIEAVGYGTGLGNSIQSMTVDSVDAEGTGTNTFLFQDMRGHVRANVFNSSQGTTEASVLCVRGGSVNFSTMGSTGVTIDNDTNSTIFTGVLNTGATKPIVQGTFTQGFFSQANGARFGINAVPYSRGSITPQQFQLIGVDLYQQAGIYPLIGQLERVITTGLQNIGILEADYICSNLIYVGGGNATWTLYPLNAAIGGASGSPTGVWYKIFNNTAFNITLSKNNATDYFAEPGAYGLSVTAGSYTIPPNGYLDVAAIYPGSGTAYWLVRQNRGCFNVGSVANKLVNYVVANLPSAATCGMGATAYVTDATLTAITGLGLAVVGGGVNKVVVVSDGTNWIIL